jgi:hypothetical protein
VFVAVIANNEENKTDFKKFFMFCIFIISVLRLYTIHLFTTGIFFRRAALIKDKTNTINTMNGTEIIGFIDNAFIWKQLRINI